MFCVLENSLIGFDSDFAELEVELELEVEVEIGPVLEEVDGRKG